MARNATHARLDGYTVSVSGGLKILPRLQQPAQRPILSLDDAEPTERRSHSNESIYLQRALRPLIVDHADQRTGQLI